MLRLIYLANIFLMGLAGIVSSLNDKLASIVIYQKVFTPNPIMQLLGSVWIAIAIISFLGLLHPLRFSPILVFQILYKSIWLATNIILFKESLPIGVSIFFIIWIFALSLSIPWKYLFKL